MALLRNATFEHGFDGWRPVNNASGVSVSRVTESPASGSYLLRVRTSVAGGSVAQDVDPLQVISVNTQTQTGALHGVGTLYEPSHFGTIWVRHAPGGVDVSGSLTLWQLNCQPPNNASTPFVAGSQWSQVTCGLDVVSGPTPIRFEIYITTINASLDLDSASLV